MTTADRQAHVGSIQYHAREGFSAPLAVLAKRRKNQADFLNRFKDDSRIKLWDFCGICL